jgi:lipid II isoglutaminyl synthase (glutamine-hydrolysing)
MVRSVSALEDFEPRFGRAEELVFDGRRLWIGLVKNPAGATVLCQQVAADPAVGAVVVSLNDLDADGQDVSWVWDAGFESLVERGLPVVASGRRAEDMALRLKYGGAGPEVPVEREPLQAIARGAVLAPPDGMVVVLATYTAMLEVREALLGRVARVQDSAA